jgi:hypothetical protein
VVSLSFFSSPDRHQAPKSDWSGRTAAGELSLSRVPRSNVSSFAKPFANSKSRRAFLELACHVSFLLDDKNPRSRKRIWTFTRSSSGAETVLDTLSELDRRPVLDESDYALAYLAATTCLSGIGWKGFCLSCFWNGQLALTTFADAVLREGMGEKFRFARPYCRRIVR